MKNLMQKGSGESIRTFVTFVVDKSGSMMGHERHVAKAVNDQIEGIRREIHGTDQEAFITVFPFDTFVGDELLDRVSVEDVGELEPEDFYGGGSTALNDAVAAAVKTLRSIPSRETDAFLVFVLTDGQENSSRQFPNPHHPHLGWRARGVNEEFRALLKEAQASGRFTFGFIVPRGMRSYPQALDIPEDNIMEWEGQADFATKAASINLCSVQNLDATRAYFCARGASAGGVTATQALYSTPPGDPLPKDEEDR